MTQELEKQEKTVQSFQQSVMQIWGDKNKIRSLFAKNLSEDEFDFFVSLGSGIGANPFTREIWAVKYGNNPASIFCGRDFYRKKAQELPEYDGHYSDTVYSNDEFSVENGVPKHSYKLTNRGSLIGAYCIVRKKNASQPFYTFVLFSEYNKQQSLWKTMPDTMIRKVAEAQGLRGSFQGTFAGTYDESEQWLDNSVKSPVTNKVEMPKPKEIKQEEALDDSMCANPEGAPQEGTIDEAKELFTDNKKQLFCSMCGREITQKVAAFSKSEYGKEMCFSCQKK